MISLQFLLTALVVVLAPGTGVIYTLAIGLGQGRWPSVAAAVGCTLGIVPHLLAATLGLAAVLHTSALLFNAVKFAGVAYLLYLAWQALKSDGALSVSADRQADSFWRTARRGAPMAIERCPGHADALTQRRRLAGRRDGLDGPHQSLSSSSSGVRGIPRISATFFWRVMIVSARCNFRWSRRFSVSSCFTRGSTGRGVGPRRRPRISRRAPASRCRRQFVSSDEYNPSRRNRAPTSPGFLHASACVRMQSRYSGEKRRR